MEGEVFPEGSPFHGLCISSHEPLKAISKRYICAGCLRSSRYFCYRCLLPPSCLQDSLPSIPLPLPLTIIKHVQELQGKSTAVHAKLLAPVDTEILLFDPVSGIVDGRDLSAESGCVVLFPAETAEYVEDVDWSDVRRLVVIDGTWRQAKAMMISETLSRLSMRPIKLRESHRTTFWRYQSLGPHCLSTIEAIYRFYQELSLHQHGKVDVRLDNLLYLFTFFYDLIQKEYTVIRPDRKFTPKHPQADYIVAHPSSSTKLEDK